MILGDTECDEDLGYFLKHGKYPKPQRCNCKYGLDKTDIDYHMHSQNQDEYYLWQGSRIPCWFE